MGDILLENENKLLFCCGYHKHRRCRIVELSQYVLTGILMSAAFAEAYLFKQLRIPFGTGSPADFHGQRDSVVFSGHIRCNAVMSVGNTVACMCPLLRAGADGVSIIGVEIDELSACLFASPIISGVRSIPVSSWPSFDSRIEKNPVPVPTSRIFRLFRSGSCFNMAARQRLPSSL